MGGREGTNPRILLPTPVCCLCPHSHPFSKVRSLSIQRDGPKPSGRLLAATAVVISHCDATNDTLLPQGVVRLLCSPCVCQPACIVDSLSPKVTEHSTDRRLFSATLYRLQRDTVLVNCSPFSSCVKDYLKGDVRRPNAEWEGSLFCQLTLQICERGPCLSCDFRQACLAVLLFERLILALK